MIRLLKFILIIVFLILSFEKLSIANNNSLLLDKISKNLRCLICQGQSVYDSQSDFAISIKILIQKKIKDGKTEIEIYEFLKKRYGQWITYNPDFNKNTFILWLLPILLFFVGGAIIVRKLIVQKL